MLRRVVHAHGWPLGTTVEAVRAAFPAAEDVTVGDSGGERGWLVPKASMVFPRRASYRGNGPSGGLSANNYDAYPLLPILILTRFR